MQHKRFITSVQRIVSSEVERQRRSIIQPSNRVEIVNGFMRFLAPRSWRLRSVPGEP